MNLAAPFIRRPIGTVLLTVGVALAGAAAFFRLPVSPLPQVDFPTISVQAQLPGASPQTMATSVATPLEKHLGVIADVTQMTSFSRVGTTHVTLQFGLDRNIDGAARDVQAAINAARVDLPATLRSNPTYRKINPAGAPVLVLALTSRSRTPGQIYDAASNIVQQQLSQVKGVGDVEVGGASLPAVRVELNPLALSNYGIGLEDVRAALASANANRPKGVLDDGAQRQQIYTNDTGTVAADYAPLLVAYRGGSAVRLADVAKVEDGVEDVNNLGLFKPSGSPTAIPAVVVTVTRQPGANIISTVDAVKARIPAVQAALPQDIHMNVAVDRTITIRASLQEVELTVLYSTLLVIAVVAFFLMNGRAVIIPSVAVAVSLLGTLAVMLALGFSLDNLSLMALAISTGFVVDDAIVVLENITRHVEAGMGRFEAALKGAEEVSFTVFAISVSLIAVFLPILLMGGIVGRLFREFALTLSAAIVISLLISLTTTPMMAAYLVGRPRPAHARGRMARFSDGLVGGMRRLYAHALDWSLDSGPIVIAILVATIALNVWLFAVVPKTFFPQQDTGQMIGGLRSDQSSSFKITEKRLRQFVGIIGRDPNVDTVVSFLGGRGVSSAFMLTALKPQSRRKENVEQVMAELRPRLMRVTGASMFLAPLQDLRIGGRPSNATYQYTLEADNLSDLRTWATRLTRAMQQQPGLEDVNSDQQDHGLQSYVTIDHDKAARLGLTDSLIDNTLYDAFGQRQVSTIYEDVNQYHVVMEVAPQYAQDPTVLSRIYVSTERAAPQSASAALQGQGAIGIATPAANVTPATRAAAVATGLAPSGASTAELAKGATVQSSATALSVSGAASTSGAAAANLAGQLAANAAAVQGTGAAGSGGAAVLGPSAPPAHAASTGVALSTTRESVVPLAAVASWADSSTPTVVNHQDTQPATTISFNLAPGTTLSDALVSIQAAQASIGMPASVHGGFQGAARAFQQSLGTEPLLVLAALVAIYMVLGILYESYIHPLTVLSTLPSASVGAVIALIVFHIDFSVIALIGVILLIGIVKKNAIMMIDFALDAERTRGLGARAAIREAALTRFRPIMMTSFAAMLGALPLAIGWGEGAELRRPLGITIIGGLLVSQVITLLTTPVVYMYLDRFRRRRAPRPAGGRASPGPLAAEQGAP
ncbi:MAG TPA: efflux RND transporter permease subunit [Caulobacteraceae bacterium]|nr:efflux RND transporter permease subunit [Caulobacteraceae bacterium]